MARTARALHATIQFSVYLQSVVAQPPLCAPTRKRYRTEEPQKSQLTQATNSGKKCHGVSETATPRQAMPHAVAVALSHSLRKSDE